MLLIADNGHGHDVPARVVDLLASAENGRQADAVFEAHLPYVPMCDRGGIWLAAEEHVNPTTS